MRVGACYILLNIGLAYRRTYRVADHMRADEGNRGGAPQTVLERVSREADDWFFPVKAKTDVEPIQTDDSPQGTLQAVLDRVRGEAIDDTYPVQANTDVDPIQTYGSRQGSHEDAEDSEGLAKDFNETGTAMPLMHVQAQRASARQKLSLVSAVACIPHPAKRGRNYRFQPQAGGEDSYFIVDPIAVGVADGVGGWAGHDIDPGEFSRELMNFAEAAVRDGEVDPAVVLERAHGRTTAAGSSTAVIVTLDTSAGALRAANLGDSGFMVVRGQQAVFRSEAQQHEFNVPYQLMAPDELEDGDDLPKDAEILTVPDVRAGDVVVLGSDGLFDNLFTEDIVDVVFFTKSLLMSDPDVISDANLAQNLADKLAAKASAYAYSKTRNGPFALEAQHHGRKKVGGKLDDITVVVSLVTEKKSEKVVTTLLQLRSRV